MEASIYCPIQMNLKDLVTLKKKKRKTEREEGVYPFSVFPRAQEPTLVSCPFLQSYLHEALDIWPNQEKLLLQQIIGFP